MPKFKGEPDLVVTCDLGTITLRFDENGFMEMGNDHPALARMRNAFPEVEDPVVEEVAAEVTVKKPSSKKK